MKKIWYTVLCLIFLSSACTALGTKEFRMVPTSFHFASTSNLVENDLVQKDLFGSIASYSYQLKQFQRLKITIRLVEKKQDEIEEQVLAEEMLELQEEMKGSSLFSIFIYNDDLYLLGNHKEERLLSISLKDSNADLFENKTVAELGFWGFSGKPLGMAENMSRVMAYAVYTDAADTPSYPANTYYDAQNLITLDQLDFKDGDIAVFVDLELLS